MSATTTTTTAPTAASVSAIEGAVFSSLPGLIGLMFAGKLAPVSVKMDGAIVEADAETAAEIDKLKGQLDALETSNPLIAQSISAFHTIASVLGLQVPSEDQVVAGVKAAAHDVLSSLKAT